MYVWFCLYKYIQQEKSGKIIRFRLKTFFFFLLLEICFLNNNNNYKKNYPLILFPAGDRYKFICLLILDETFKMLGIYKLVLFDKLNKIPINQIGVWVFGSDGNILQLIILLFNSFFFLILGGFNYK
jgi:hypothetical protein